MRKLIKSFGYAFSGLKYAFCTQANFRFHTIALIIVAFMAWSLKISKHECLYIALVCGLVIITELLNTSIEALVDLISPGYHEKAKVIKDVSAGAVLVASFIAILTGLVIFIPKIV